MFLDFGFLNYAPVNLATSLTVGVLLLTLLQVSGRCIIVLAAAEQGFTIAVATTQRQNPDRKGGGNNRRASNRSETSSRIEVRLISMSNKISTWSGGSIGVAALRLLRPS